ncbi:hypothetical protein [Tsuneonella sp. SYSU-LHT278]|uniref:hypothetical protein n=1 Tax=Tsuneonella sediminis TaxID=3416089 RepID=UPI003F7AC984
MIDAAEYPLPQGQLSLSGPVARPAVGTVAIRGDLAHIALADRYLCAHYVVPQVRTIGEAGANLLSHPRDGSDPVTRLDPGTRFEALDYSGPWCWGCLGPEGPSGYLRLDELVSEG